MIVLSALFMLRVAAQALQRWWPLDRLPPFDAWQGSDLSYPLLLSMQMLIVVAMCRVCWHTLRGTHPVSRRAGRWLAGLGAIYMSGSLLRIAVGLTVSHASPWFSAWISSVFHVLLAAFLLTAAHYYLRARAML
ncbi:MAG: hypothetical protein ACI8W7_003288 [Gammaproteobacteria bacterium]|jgi:hypothetical protein